jgi:diguanylate cyclase (GGDEF)-like protein
MVHAAMTIILSFQSSAVIVMSARGATLDIRQANDSVVTLEDALLLIDEIARLRAELARCETRIFELDQLAHRDALVELPNRRSFLANLERLIARVDRYDDPAAVLFVDVDGLKEINDRFGHDAGDQALVQVARLVSGAVRAGDLVARLGGDEFAVLLEHSDELSAWQLALRVTEILDETRSFCVNGTCLPLSAAVGVATIEAGDSAKSVLKRADQEMYRIKAI